MCSLHFQASDFITESQDLFKYRAGQAENKPLKKKKLTESAVPSLFPNLASYHSKPEIKKRTGAATSSARHVLFNVRVQKWPNFRLLSQTHGREEALVVLQPDPDH